MKKKKKIIIAVSVVLVAAIAASTLFSNKGPVAVPVQTVPLAASPLTSTIEASGNVESTTEVKVYAEVTAPIKRVLVKEGDVVAAGDLLAELDSTDLHNNLTQREIALRTGNEASQQRIKLAEKNYEDTKKTLSEGTNAQLNAAREQLDSTQRALATAKENHDIAKARVDQETKDQLITPRAAVDAAQTAYDRAYKLYRDTKKDVNDDNDELRDKIKQLKKDISAAPDADTKKQLQAEKEELEERLDNFEDENGIFNDIGVLEISLKDLRQKYEDAQTALTNAKKDLAAAETTANNAATDKMREHVRTVENAQIAYDNALRNVKTIETTINQTLENAQESITSEKIAANTEALQAEIKSLRTNVEKCQIKAPSSGTVTAVYAVENSTATGLLFLIENTEALQVTVKVKEYDIPNIKEGMKAIITADATDNMEYEGIVQKVHPAAIRTEATAATKSSNVEFETEILVQTADTPLRIGMSAKAKIVLEEKDSTLAISYDALTTDEKGNTIIYTVQKQADNTYHTVALPVQTGLETDFAVEVSGEGLTAGIPVISDAKSVMPGMLVTVEGGAQALAEAVSSNPAEVTP